MIYHKKLMNMFIELEEQEELETKEEHYRSSPEGEMNNWPVLW